MGAFACELWLGDSDAGESFSLGALASEPWLEYLENFGLGALAWELWLGDSEAGGTGWGNWLARTGGTGVWRLWLPPL